MSAHRGWGVVGVGDHQRRVGGRADQVADLGELGLRSARPSPSAVHAVAREIFGDEPPGEAGRAIDDDVEIAVHGSLPKVTNSYAKPLRERRCACPLEGERKAEFSVSAACRTEWWAAAIGWKAVVSPRTWRQGTCRRLCGWRSRNRSWLQADTHCLPARFWRPLTRLLVPDALACLTLCAVGAGLSRIAHRADTPFNARQSENLNPSPLRLTGALLGQAHSSSVVTLTKG